VAVNSTPNTASPPADTTVSHEPAVAPGAADSLLKRAGPGAPAKQGESRKKRMASPPGALSLPALDTSSQKKVSASDTAGADRVMTNPCSKDTVPPWIFPDPAGGMHRRHVAVHLLSVERCSILWRYKGEKVWRAYGGEAIAVTADTTIEFFGADTCGNTLEARSETYRIEKPLLHRRCPQDMEFVKVGETAFCIDRYEWPNVRGAKPFSHISYYHAADSCFTKQKSLCSTENWMLACGGPYGWQYPYGAVYEPKACNTQDSIAHASGADVECRGYFDVYDMSGNLAEWTRTPARANAAFFNVMGGFWQSGSESNCSDARYSYFPQNRHNPVGFRCCKDAGDGKAAK
jgi:hypothetical protein